MIRSVFFLALFGAAGMSARADDWERWRDGRRVLILRTSSRNDARWVQQATTLSANREGLGQRDVVVVVWEGDRAPSEWPEDTEIPPAEAFLRHFTGLKPADWRVTLIGRDGRVKAEWDRPVATDELFVRIDSMPMGRLEMEKRRKTGR